MRALTFYTIGSLLLLNVVGEAMDGIKGYMEHQQDLRVQQLCNVDPALCPTSNQ